MSDTNTEAATGSAVELDAIVVGAGFGGIRTLVELDRRGLDARILEAGSDIGGTWYWNRYPGARTDSLSWTYCYFFDKELALSWDWVHNYPERETVQGYLRHVVDRFSLGSRIQYSTRVTRAIFDETTNRWTVSTNTGQTFVASYFISCVGHLSEPIKPDFVNEANFGGEVYYTAQWPKEEVDFTGKRVALVGTGASAVQAGPRIAKQAAQLTVFQRTPNYVLPARYRDLTDADRADLRERYDEIHDRTRVQPWGFDMNFAGRMYDDVDDEQRQAVFEENYQKGGFFFVFEAFDDLVTDKRTNEAAGEFLRKKIRDVVKDPKTAELLSPKYPLVSKRPPVGEGYFEMFNDDHVSLVDVSSDPLVTMTPTGLRTTSAAEYEADVVVVATGFDVSTGSLTAMEVRGLGGKLLADEWRFGVDSFLGVGVHGFPNMFMVAGPQAGAGNQPVIMERITEFIGELIEHARAEGTERLEVTSEAAKAWTAHVEEVLAATVVAKSMHDTNSWLVGGNTPGKVKQSMLYLGGFDAYSARMRSSADAGFPEFTLSAS